MYTEEVPIYTNHSITQRRKAMYTEEVPIYTNHSITQRRKGNVYRRGTYIYQSFNYTEEVRQCIQKRYLYIYINIYTNHSITQRR
jgi:hypothetical protein